MEDLAKPLKTSNSKSRPVAVLGLALAVCLVVLLLRHPAVSHPAADPKMALDRKQVASGKKPASDVDFASNDQIHRSSASSHQQSDSDVPVPPFTGSGGEKWIKLAEGACVPSFSYTVKVTTVMTNASPGSGPSAADSPNAVSMVYSRERGLKLSQRGAAVSFSIDLASMVRDAGPAAPWNVVSATQNEIEIGSTNGRIALRVWVRRDDGAISKFEQDMDGKLLASSSLSYLELDGAFVPDETRTFFPATGRLYLQRYSDYEILKSR